MQTSRPAPAAPRKINYGILLGGLLMVVVLVWLLGSGFGKDPHRIDTDALEGKPAPRFELVDLDGNRVNLNDYIGKQWVVINFWSTWCGPCKIEHPELLKAPGLWPDVVWLGIVYQDEPDAIRRHLVKHGSAYPHLVDPAGAMSVDYGVTGVPETFFIDPSGTIVRKFAEPIGLGHMASVLGRPASMR